MMLGDQVLGVINVQDTKRELRFTEDDAALLTTIASQIAAAIQNTRLLDQVQRTARRERVIRQITGKVRRSPSMRTILETTAQELGRALDAARATVRLGEEELQAPSGAETSQPGSEASEERADLEEASP
jgi:GAF domain-containing protein